MSAAIEIVISNEATFDIVHRFRNFGEDIFRSLREICTVDLEEIDASTTGFTVRNIRRCDLGDVTRTIERALKKHHFDQTSTLTRL